MHVLFWTLLVVFVPFVLPILNLVAQRRLRHRVRDLEESLESQRQTLADTENALRALRQDLLTVRAAAAPAPPPPAPTHAARPEPVPSAPARPEAARAEPAAPGIAQPPPAPRPAPAVEPPAQPLARGDRAKEEMPAAAVSTGGGFDWESVVGVQLFSAIAGIALVLAAVFFLKYSIDHGWLAPRVRVAIGIVISTALLIACEWKAARKYPATANAMDAAAIAILFATFFAAHALWGLIPTGTTFGLLALVTVVAVLLSIRRDSMFIALLGLVGGFATPALLSTGENRPIPLFVYLLLLNIGLAMVAYRKQWRALAIISLVLTTLYQWSWVITFLTASELSLAMGIFLMFAITSYAGLAVVRRGASDELMDRALGDSALAASAMPLVFSVFLAAVPQYGAHAALLFGFLLLVDIGLLAVALGADEERLHATGGLATLLVFAVWLATSYATTAWRVAIGFVVVFSALYALAPMLGERIGRQFRRSGAHAALAAPALLFVFPVIAAIEPETAAPSILFGAMFVALAAIAWRALSASEARLYYLAAFFGVTAEATWSAAHLETGRLGAAVALYTAFALFYLAVPLASRAVGRSMTPRWGAGAVLIAALMLLLYLAGGPHAPAALWGMALLLAILDAGLFVESASCRLPALSITGGVLSWIVLGVWWANAAAIVGVFPALLVLVGLTLLMLAGHVWMHRMGAGAGGDQEAAPSSGFRPGIYLGLVGQLFLFFVAQDPQWSIPPWPMFAALTVMTLAFTATSLAVDAPALNAAGVIAASAVVLAFSGTSPGIWSGTALGAGELAAAYACAQLFIIPRRSPAAAAHGQSDAGAPAAALPVGAACALFITELTAISTSATSQPPALVPLMLAHASNLSVVLAIAWSRRWHFIAPAAVVPAWLAAATWQMHHPEPAQWQGCLALATVLYGVFASYPFILGRRAQSSRDPHLTAVAGSVFYLFAARAALLQGGLSSIVGSVPVVEGAVMAALLRMLVRVQPPHDRDNGRVALVAGAALAFATVAIPLQLNHQWITLGWALEGAALAWLYRRIPHRGLFYWATALLGVVFVRLALNPAVFIYEPRGMRVFNWYLYTYAICAAAMLVASWWFSRTDDRLGDALPRASALLSAGGVILLFLVLNIEIADFYATGREITFRFGVTLAQDLTYTIGWLVFGLALLTAGIYARSRPGRVAAVALIAVTTCKAFLYDLGSLGGLYRVGSLVGLAVSLALVALALQKFVLQAPKEA